MRKAALIIAMIATFGIAGCAGNEYGTKQNYGTLGGAVLGGLAGSQIGGGTGQLWATGAGVLLGGIVGNQIGASLDKADKVYASNAMNTAYNAPIGQSVTWNNPQSGHYGEITPVRDGWTQQGNYCREYQTKVNIGGKNQNAYGTACRQPDGSWQVQN